MPELYTPRDYQSRAIGFGVEQTANGGGVAYFLDPGLGKTSITLALLKLLREFRKAGPALIVAPLRVVYSVWRQECELWQQFDYNRVSIIHGTPVQRVDALNTDADLYLINAEGVPWLTRHLITEAGGIVKQTSTGRQIANLIKRNRFNLTERWSTLIVDESSLFKSPSALRTQCLHGWCDQFTHRAILTGTPAPNGLLDLWSQLYLLDQGAALGKNITAYRSRYFYKESHRFGKWLPHPQSEAAILQAIAPFTLTLSAKDHLSLPPLIENDIWCRLPTDKRKQYRKLERELFVELESGGEIVAGSAGAKYAACRGFANGGMYEYADRFQAERITHHLHNAKTDALAELIGELQGKPLLIAYQFQHDLERIRQKLGEVPAINGQTPAAEGNRLVEEWNAGQLPLLAVQPQALSHGVNMQASGTDIAWYGLTDNLETYQQLNARLHRSGVSGTVRVHRLLVTGTVDEAIRQRIESKDATQQGLLKALRGYRNKETR